MCDTCGCGDPELVSVPVHERILATNHRVARHNREHFRDAGVLAINLMGSPGSGKTAILEATARALGASHRIGVLVGDLATDNDAQRARAAGVVAEAITTGSACHLDAEMVHHGLHHLPWRELEYLFIENVGNLVCPAEFDVGEHAKAMVLSVTEGEDKPLKYPVMFRSVDVVLLNKIDLVPYLDADVDAYIAHVREVNAAATILPVSARTGAGMDAWFGWLRRFAAGTVC